MDHPNVLKIVDRVQGSWSRPGKKDQEVFLGKDMSTSNDFSEEKSRFSRELGK